MPTATLAFAAAILVGPATPGSYGGVSLPTAMVGLAAPDPSSTPPPSTLAPAPPVAEPPAESAPIAGPPAAAPVAGPPAPAPAPAPAPVASPPTPAPASTAAERIPPSPEPVLTSPTAELPSADGLSRALTEARELQHAEPEEEWEDMLDPPRTQTVVVKIPARDSYAYDDQAYDALYDDDPPELRISGYGGVSVHGSTILHNPAVWVGGRGGLILGERFSIGGAFYQLSYRHGGPIVDPTGRELGIRAAYGGLQVGYVLFDRHRFELDLDTLIGAGSACISAQPGFADDDWRCIEAVRMFVTEPGLSARFEVVEFLRLGLTAGYRFVAREQWRPPNDFQVSGPYVGVDVDFGWFPYE